MAMVPAFTPRTLTIFSTGLMAAPECPHRSAGIGSLAYSHFHMDLSAFLVAAFCA